MNERLLIGLNIKNGGVLLNKYLQIYTFELNRHFNKKVTLWGDLIFFNYQYNLF